MSIWQRPHLFVWDYRSAPPELLAPLRPEYAAVHVHLVDHGDVPSAWVKAVKALGYVVFGVIGDYDRGKRPWRSWQDPIWFFDSAQARFRAEGAGEIGLCCNFEDEWEARDRPTDGVWSQAFTQDFRHWWGKKNLCLNTYDGCGDIDLAAWADKNARLYVQTYNGSVQPPQVIPISSLKLWARAYGWPKRKEGMIKPCLAVYGPPRVSIERQVEAMQGTVGYLAYYADGADLGQPEKYLRPLAQQAIQAGVAR